MADGRGATVRAVGSDDGVSQLCQECALCCNGVLFPKVVIVRDDPDRLRGLGFELEVFADCGLGIPQPCVKLEGLRCAVYRDRPCSCAAYECRVVDRLRAAAIDLVRAGQIVAAARRVLEEAAEHLGTDPSSAVFAAAAAGTSGPSRIPIEPARLASGRLAVADLMLRRKRDFLQP